jgi:tetratricopeptide (TPR) repeat protein
MKLHAIDITGIEVEDIFASNYKYYESHSLGRIFIRNNSENAIPAIKISLMVQGFMDYATEAVTENLAGGKSVEVLLKAVFNNTLLYLTENSVLQSEITVSYTEGTESKTVSFSKPLNVYEKHALIWDKAEKASTFITPKDPAILDLATKAASVYTALQINKHFLHAMGVFEALGIMGITYMNDPNNPYQKVSTEVSTVDFIQYPRETLSRKAGDCDDLVVLYASMLESLAINTAFVTYPGHILLMFDTSVSSKLKEDFGFPPDDYVVYKGTIWIPVETTLVGSSFTAAWKKALNDFNEWKEKGLQIVDMKDAWQDYKPATLQFEDLSTEAIIPAKISEKFPKELEALKERKVHYLRSFFLNSPDSSYALEQLGILYAENGMYEEAMETLKRQIRVKGENATTLNNSGNLFYLTGDYRNAENAYLKALKYDQEDTGIMINLARCYSRQSKKEKARKYLDMAIRIDPDVTKKYFRLSSELRR